jgi:pimeloyl-ACP methyl ester carboxylesterase
LTEVVNRLSAMKRLVLIIIIALCLQLSFGSPVSSAPEAVQLLELNFVFLHGGGGNACSMQPLADIIRDELPAYILDYEQDHPDTEVRFNILLRCYPNYVDTESWADNIADSIDKYLPDKNNIILIGHSMGGKAALYAVAHNVGNLAYRTAMVATINSPIDSLQGYYFAGGTSVSDYFRTLGLLSATGVSKAVVYYDSSEDGREVVSKNHWLAFIAAESAPLSEQHNVGGVDALPRNMDDNIIPISAQYLSGADVVYYGEHSHTDFANQEEVAALIAEQILSYIFGGYIECSVPAGSGSLEHKAGWLPGTDFWEDVVGEITASSGTIQHFNESYTSWQEWEDIVGECLPEDMRSSYQVNHVGHFPFLASVEETRWLNDDDPYDCQLYIKTRAAPRNQVEVEWSIYDSELLPLGAGRNHYEVEITTGTPLTSIHRVSWVSDDPYDTRLRIHSEAESPFRWFQAEWRVYSTESRYRQIIEEMWVQPPS